MKQNEIYYFQYVRVAVSQKKCEFVHNDLHSSNIMFKNTTKEYLYFNFKGNYFRIPL